MKGRIVAIKLFLLIAMDAAQDW